MHMNEIIQLKSYEIILKINVDKSSLVKKRSWLPYPSKQYQLDIQLKSWIFVDVLSIKDLLHVCSYLL